jgi:hypothetical protein
MKWAGHVACTEKIRNIYKNTAVKCEGNRPHGIYRHRWEDNIKMVLKN